ncbi:response regulator transcription factor [Dehalogenimonas sp. 4OHTPN]|uniref:Response regulator transcription factor n=1 Tax=Dehalogenimonas sp. 4OHTPN TaxID=3166643 RepID=A0AAU8G8Z8_9CHLR
MTISIFLADDHRVVRAGIKALLESQTDFNVIGETEDGLEAVKQVEQLHPDVLIVDLMLHGISGIEVCRQVVKHSTRTVVVILSMYGNETYVQGALRAGAKGYLLKEATVDELVSAVREVMKGRHYLSASLSQRAIENYIKQQETDTITDPYEQLSTREREVLHLVARGHTGSDIARRLFISPRTVEAHRANLMRKLDMRNHSQLVRYALQKGIISAENEGLPENHDGG